MMELDLAERMQQNAKHVDQPLVSALLLTIGESTTSDAHEALQRQTVPLHEILAIENIRPFSNAFNQGVSRINTPFFIQCDADMILDENCVEVLLSKVTEGTAMVVGILRDPLQGRIQGVKLYRTSCCKLFPMLDSSDCERILQTQLLRNHWVVTVEDSTIPLGRHDPDPKDLIYHFERFKFQGVKIRARRQWSDLMYRLVQLVRSGNQEIVPMAVSAMVCGFHLTHKKDHLKGFTSSAEYRLWLERSLPGPVRSRITKPYPRLGIFNFFIAYWNGLQVRKNLRKSQMEELIQYLHSDQMFGWAYLLGFLSAVMNASETIRQNFLTRTFRIIPFLRYLRKKLNHRIHSRPN